MSKIGKRPILIPKGVEINLKDDEIEVKGEKGVLKKKINSSISVKIKDDYLKLEPRQKLKGSKAIWGTERALIANMIKGVSEGFEKELEIEGTGYDAKLEGKTLKLSLGFSHQVNFEVPEDVSIEVKGNRIKISGIDKQKVGEIAAQIRRFKPPEPYKGKGIRYVGEIIRRKAGKKAATSSK